MFSTDNAKAAKAAGYGWLNAIHYMAPAEIAGVGNLCPHHSKGCLRACLGWYSGHAGMVSHQLAHNDVRRSRIAKARLFMQNRGMYIEMLVNGVMEVKRKARKAGLKPCVRLNGSTDIAWERIKTSVGLSIVEAFGEVQFVDYTKSKRRALQWANGQLPINLDLTFSRSENNELDCIEVLKAGGRVAVVFGERPSMLYGRWHGFPIVDGDKHDLRHLDPRGVVVALSPKGRRAKADRTGFVVWS